MATGQCVATFTWERWFQACAVAPDGVTIIAGDDAGDVHILRLVLPHPAAHAPVSQAPPGGRAYPGPVKRAVCGRLPADWKDLADELGVPTADRRTFDPDRGPHGVWEWLEDRGRLPDLGPALAAIGRGDLAALLRDAGGG